jgi:hypothetical protein
MPVPIHFPGNPREREVFRPAPSDDGFVRRAERPVVTPMRGRGHVAPRNFRVLDAADRSKGVSHPDAELNVGDIVWSGVIHEYILSVECDHTALRGSVDLIEQRTKARRDLAEGHAVANHCERTRCDALDRNRIDHGHDAARSRLNGQPLVFHDQTRNVTHPKASTPTPKRITSSCVVAKTKIHPSTATSAGIG